MLIDSHCHMDAAEFDADRPEVIARAQAAGVTAQVIPAIARNGFEKLRDLCASAPGLHPAYGLHPMFLAAHRPQHLDVLREWIEQEHPVAIGECGLDFFIEGFDRHSQHMYFQRQLELAREFELPLIVHARSAVEETIGMIRRVGGLRGVIHSYSGSAEQAAQLWKMGFSLGIGGPVTHDRARRLRALVAQMPLEFLLLETDSPDQPPNGHRGERNEPAYLREVLGAVAELRGADGHSIEKATSENACRLFRLPAPTPLS
ncbi:MAG: TatD family hydrolase [Dokdonella sp.]